MSVITRYSVFTKTCNRFLFVIHSSEWHDGDGRPSDTQIVMTEEPIRLDAGIECRYDFPLITVYDSTALYFQ